MVDEMLRLASGLPPQWWAVADAPVVFGDDGVRLLDWLHKTVARPHLQIGRSGPLCPFVPATLRLGLLYATVADPGGNPETILNSAVDLFLRTPPMPPDSASVNKSLLVLFPEAGGDELTKAVRQVKGSLIARHATCGEFFPDSDDRSARADQVLIARSPIPLVAVRYLTSHDRLFLSGHDEYGPLFNEWEARHG